MTSPMSPAERAEAMARCEAATEGPWSVQRNANNYWGMIEVIGAALRIMGFTVATDVSAEQALQKRADADFIAHVRTDYPCLEATLRAVEAERDEAQAEEKGVCETLHFEMSVKAEWRDRAIKAEATIASLSADLAGKEAENADALYFLSWFVYVGSLCGLGLWWLGAFG